ncbi:MAG: hypothetical protein AB7W28_02595 [Armatimonadota bacterium]
MRMLGYVLSLLLVLLLGSHAQARVWLETGRDVKLEGQLLANPDLERVANGQAEGWFGWEAGYQIDEQVKRSGRFSALCIPSEPGKQYGIGQTVVLNQEKPTPLLARAWSRAEQVSGAPDSNYSLYLDLEYTDGTPLWGQVSPFATGTHDWQQATVLVMPAKPIKSVNVYGIFRSHSGKAWFDDFDLYEIGGAGQFDLLPALGKIPAGKPAWGKLSFGAGQTLFVDPKSGAMSLDDERLGGLILRDVATDSAFILPELAVTQTSEGVKLSGKVQELNLEIEATVKAAQGAVRLDATVHDMAGHDRAITVYLALPVPEAAWIWCENPRRSHLATEKATCGTFCRVGVGANDLASLYPFAPVCNENQGIALGAPISVPRLARFAFDGQRQVLYGAFDLGLSQATAKFPSAASFSVLLYDFDQQWRFRSALLRYYELNADAFTRRVQKQGIWMPFMDIAAVSGWEDFGFQFQEGAPNPAFDEAHGIYSFPYIEPMSFWMPMPKEMPREEAEALKLLDRLAAEGNQRAIATKSSGIYGPDGRLAMDFQDTPWCDGALFLLNCDPDLPAPPDAPVTQYMVHEATLNRVLSDKAGMVGWNPYGAGFEIVDNEGIKDSRCAKCVRQPGAEPMGLSQTVTLSQQAPRPLVATAWSKAEGVTGEKGSDYSLYLDLTYRDGDHQWGQVASFDTGTHDWQQVTVRFEPTKPLAAASVHLLFRGNMYGTVWFDDISVREEGNEKELARDGSFDAPPTPVEIDGLYLDSFEMAATLRNYRREHFASADLPLVFDRSGTLCEMGHFMAMELANHVAEILHQRGKLLFANAVFHNFPWPAGCMDVFGTETNWNPGGTWRPNSDEQMLYWRAMCYQRPYLTLQNTNFDQFSYEMTERYLARCSAYGVLPSFFSPDASTGVYWSRPELYNRDRDLFKRYIPVVRQMAEAGWQPLTWAEAGDPELWVERFGDGDEVFLTVFNPTDAPKEARVVVNLAQLGLKGTCSASLLLPEERELGEVVAGAEWTWRGQLGPEQLAVVKLARR